MLILAEQSTAPDWLEQQRMDDIVSSRSTVHRRG